MANDLESRIAYLKQKYRQDNADRERTAHREAAAAEARLREQYELSFRTFCLNNGVEWLLDLPHARPREKLMVNGRHLWTEWFTVPGHPQPLGLAMTGSADWFIPLSGPWSVGVLHFEHLAEALIAAEQAPKVDPDVKKPMPVIAVKR